MIRPDVIESIKDYEARGVPTGHFLRAVLAHDLFGAFAYADSQNRDALGEIVAFIHNYLRSDCHGSYAKVDGWVERHTILREASHASE